MKRYSLISTLVTAALALLVASCSRNMEEDMRGQNLPEGTPITMRIDFGADNLVNLDVSTKAEALSADEERVHDLYVMIFCDGEGEGHVTRGQKIYGRYFSYEHLQSSLSALDASPNEGWFVENRSIDNSVTKTRGAVKISTRVCSSAKLVVIANVDNGICKLGDQDDVLDYLNGIRTYDQLRQAQVKLTQDIVNRKNLFLMLGVPEDGSGDPKNVNTGDMVWGTTSPSTAYNSDYRIYLRPVDAKVKFKVRVNDPDAVLKDENGNPILDGSGNTQPANYISAAKAVYWEACNVPDRCYLFSDYDSGRAPEGTVYFDSGQAYFEGTEGDYYVFSFYMLESRHREKAHADAYHKREKQSKVQSDKSGYTGPSSGEFGNYYVENGEWEYAMPNATYVKFDMILTLTPEGVRRLGGSVSHALTSDTIFTVHLGEFSNTGLAYPYDDYNTYRSSYYTYYITIANSGSIYAEVKRDDEVEPGQEGYLLLTDDEIVNADCHYEYHSITFTYDPETSAEKFSWYVKTPFTSQVGGGPQKSYKTVNGVNYPVYDPHDTDGTLLDYRWVKFGVNKVVNGEYTTNRLAYPGNGAYDKDWGVGDDGPWNSTHPELMDISQLIQYIFEETKKETASSGSSDFKTDPVSGEKIIRVTIFIDEYYYEVDPRDESDSPKADPNLWRQFVNAHPREMHILSKTTQSRDRKSDVIESSHSVIQQSIQTIYNIYEPTLRTIWGCEHLDEIKQKEPAGAGDWLYWPINCTEGGENGRAGANNDVGKENGRLNSAYIWGLYNSQGNNGSMTTPLRDWNNFLNYEVDNMVPELRDDDIADDYGSSHHYHGMAWSCLTRNRDNNGNGKIDPEEIRWYMAASQQLIGLWVGNESLSTSARLYQPAPGQWRAHVVSSTAKKVAWAEEGAGATDLANDWAGSGSAYHTWNSNTEAAKGESVRCIRNIGTYDEGGVVTDISYAPVTLIPDRYFTLKLSDGNTESDVLTYDDPDKYYIFFFDRLNTKSIREYSPGELPYHDQMSMNNRVYVKLVTQPYSTVVDAFSETLLSINNKVTQKGTNDYCPPGYRFPNHTEFLLMELYLPSPYLKRDKTEEYPTRTYYNRGSLGSLKDASWSSEYTKLGWRFTDKLHCVAPDGSINRTRCVKDEDQTGVISGQIAVEGKTIYPGDLIPVDFKFSSTASTFTSATLTLWYTKNGFRTPYDLTSQMVTPKGLQYKGVQSIRIPTLADLGISAAGLPYADMSIEASFTNLNGQSGSHELPVRMENPLEASCSINDATDGKVYPHDKNKVTLRLSTKAHTLALSDVSLKLCYDDEKRDISIPDLGSGVRVYNHTNLEIDIPTFAQLSGISESDLLTGKTAHLEATVKTKTSNTETLEKTVSSADFTLSHPIVANTFTIDTDSKIYPGDSNTVSLEFASQGHVPQNLSTVTVQLYNTDGETPMGARIVDESGIAQALFSSSSPVAIPSLADLGLDVSALDPGTDYILRAIVTNVDGLSRTIDKTLTLSNPISGTIEVPDGYVYSADDNTLGFNVSSLAKTSALTGVSMMVTYTGIDGNTHNVTSGFSGLANPTGKTYSGNKTVTFPLFTSTPNVDAVDTSQPVTLTATFTDDGGITRDIICNVPIRPHINVPVLQIPSDYSGSSPSYVFPVEAKLGDAVPGYDVLAMKLLWKKNGETVWTTDTFDFNENNTDFQTVSDASTRASLSLATGSYINYRAMTICSTDGTAAFSPVWSMWLARYNFVKSDTEKWSFDIQNLDIPRGDFIQASISPTGGWNVETNTSSTKYELIGFGVGDSEAVFYPAPKSATPDKTIHVQRRDGNLRVYGWYRNANNWRYAHYNNISSPINVLFNRDGLYYQNLNKFNPTSVDRDNLSDNITNLINAKRMQVGSAQGVERPYATYHFVRVVRQYEIPEQ